MAQETLVFRVGEADRALLEDRLRAGTFRLEPADHAWFRVRGEGVVATLYRSGKLVVQGSGATLFAGRYLPEDLTAASPGKSAPAPDDAALIDPTRPVVGSDETGKGDYFGPLVVVALRLEPGDRAALAQGGVTDSKALSDTRVRVLGPALMERFPHAVERLDPPEYNREHARLGNLNPLLADLHARAIRAVAHEGDQVLVDRFASESLVAGRLADAKVDLIQRTRAEREVAVAAASVVARFVFLEALQELSEAHAVELRKGAGDPTDAAARAFVELHGFEALGRVAKLHFKNTGKLRG